MSQIHRLILVVLSPPSLEPLILPFYCSPVPVLKNRLKGDDTFKGSGRFADTCRHEILVEGAGKGTEEHAQISFCLPEASRSGENQGHARDT